MRSPSAPSGSLCNAAAPELNRHRTDQPIRLQSAAWPRCAGLRTESSGATGGRDSARRLWLLRGPLARFASVQGAAGLAWRTRRRVQRLGCARHAQHERQRPAVSDPIHVARLPLPAPPSGQRHKPNSSMACWRVDCCQEISDRARRQLRASAGSILPGRLRRHLSIVSL